jgi:hypothetical protein
MYAPDANTRHQRCLGIDSNHNAPLRSCTYVHDQAWYRGKELRKTSYYQYKNAYGHCLGVKNGSKHKAAQVIAGTCLGSRHPDQYWSIHYLNAHTYLCEVFNYHSQYVLEPRSDTKNAPIVQQPWAGHSTARQEWSFEINS